jgi:hypothetical protein
MEEIVMHFKKQLIAAAVGVGLMSGAANASGVFDITGAKSASTPIYSISDAQKLLDGQITHSSFLTGTAPVVNFDDPGNAGAKWHFGNKAPFIIDTPGVDNYFAIQATGTLVIPSAGNYTFGVNSDDGFSLTVGAFSLASTGLKESSDVMQTFDFTKAGDYPLNLYYFQAYGQAQVELYATPGSYTTFGAAGSNFQLINSPPTSGALQLASVPEPASATMIALGATALLKRRRRSI